jgi:hypothetical protein
VLTKNSLSQTSIWAPNELKIDAIIRVSETFGTLVSLEVPEQQRVAARIDNAEFLEPLMGTWPESLEGPVMVSLGSGVWEKRESGFEREWEWGFRGLRGLEG